MSAFAFNKLVLIALLLWNKNFKEYLLKNIVNLIKKES